MCTSNHLLGNKSNLACLICFQGVLVSTNLSRGPTCVQNILERHLNLADNSGENSHQTQPRTNAYIECMYYRHPNHNLHLLVCKPSTCTKHRSSSFRTVEVRHSIGAMDKFRHLQRMVIGLSLPR